MLTKSSQSTLDIFFKNIGYLNGKEAVYEFRKALDAYLDLYNAKKIGFTKKVNNLPFMQMALLFICAATQ